jgi:hypothetical protein
VERIHVAQGTGKYLAAVNTVMNHWFYKRWDINFFGRTLLLGVTFKYWFSDLESMHDDNCL